MIRSLELHNFKCFTQRSLSLSKINLLAGMNGAGKSSVIQALLLLRQSYKHGFLARNSVALSHAGLALNGELVCLGTARDALYYGADDDLISFQLNLDEGSNSTWTFAYKNPEANVLELREASSLEAVYESSLFSDEFHYLEAERLGPRVSFEMSDSLVRRHRQLGSKGQFTAHFLEVFGRSEDIANPALAHPVGTSMRLRDQVEAWLSEISPGVRLSISATSGIDAVSLGYSFASSEDVTNVFRATNVGFGISYILPILVALLSARPGSLLLIENPEAHLHPRGQVEIGRLLVRAAAGGVQILVESHSDHVLNGMRLAVHGGDALPSDIKFHFFRREDIDGKPMTQIVSPEIDRNGRINTWPEGFFDEFDKSLDALLSPSSH